MTNPIAGDIKIKNFGRDRKFRSVDELQGTLSEQYKGQHVSVVYRHLMHGQRMMVTASFARREPIQVTGPFADEAMKIISSMKMNKAKPTALSV